MASWPNHKPECKKMRELRKTQASKRRIPYLKRCQRARQFCLQEKWPQAENELRLMLLEDETDSGTWGNLGSVLEAQGNIHQAILCLRKSVQLRPDRADTHYNLGVTLQNCDQLEEAIECYGNCLRLDPKHKNAATNRHIAKSLLQGPQTLPGGVTVETTSDRSSGVVTYSVRAPGK